MRPLLAALLVVMGSVAAWGFAEGRDENPERRESGHFLDVLVPGDAILLADPFSLVGRDDAYSLTVLTPDDLRQLQPTPEELKEHRALNVEYMQLLRADDDKAVEQWRKQHMSRYSELSEKILRPIPKIVEVGENYVGWRHKDGRIEYVPERRIDKITKGLRHPVAETE